MISRNKTQKSKTTEILNRIGFGKDKSQSSMNFKDFLKITNLKSIFAYLDFKLQLRVLPSFTETITKDLNLVPKIFIKSIVKLLEGDFDKSCLHHKHYLKIKTNISKCQHSLLSYSGLIKEDNLNRAAQSLVLVGFFNEMTYPAVKRMIKNSGVMFVQDKTVVRKSISSKTQLKRESELKNILKNLLSEKKEFLEEFWRAECISLSKPRIFMVYYMSLQSKKEDESYDFSKFQQEVLREMNPFRDYGININILCSKAAYKTLKKESYKESIEIIDKYCMLLKQKVPVSRKTSLVQKHENAVLIKIEEIPSKIALCIYLTYNTIVDQSDNSIKYQFQYEATFIPDSFIPKNVKQINKNTETLTKSYNLPPFIKMLFGKNDYLDFKDLKKYSFSSEAVKIFILYENSEEIQSLKLITNEEKPFQKLEVFRNFSIYFIETFILPMTNFKIEVGKEGNHKKYDFLYKNGKGLFIPKSRFKKSLFDYGSFVIFLEFIASRNLANLIESLAISTNLKKNRLIEFCETYLKEQSSASRDTNEIASLVLINHFKMSELDHNSKSIVLKFLLSLSFESSGVIFGNEFFLECFVCAFVGLSETKDLEISSKLSRIVEILTEKLHKKPFSVKICRILMKDSNVVYNENLSFLEDFLTVQDAEESREILETLLALSTDLLIIVKSAALMNEDKENLRIMRHRIEKSRENMLSLKLSDLSQTFSIIISSKSLSNVFKELADFICPLIHQSIKNDVINGKIVNLQSLIENHKTIFFSSKSFLDIVQRRNIFRELLSTQCFDINIYDFFQTTFENFSEEIVSVDSKLLDDCIKEWTYFQKGIKIDLVKEMLEKLNLAKYCRFNNICQYVCLVLLDSVSYNQLLINLKKGSSINNMPETSDSIKDINIFTYIDFFYEFLGFKPLIESYKVYVGLKITASNWKKQFETFKDLKNEIKYSEIGLFIISTIVNISSISISRDLDLEFKENSKLNDFFATLCNVREQHLNQNKDQSLSEIENELFTYIKKFFETLAMKKLSVQIIKNLQKDDFHKKISFYLTFYLKVFKPKSYDSDILDVFLGEYRKINTYIIGINETLEFLQKNAINTHEDYRKEFETLTEKLENNLFSNFEIPKKYEKLAQTSIKFQIISSYSKFKAIIIRKLFKPNSINLEEIVEIIDFNFSHIEEYCLRTSKLSLESKIEYFSEFLNFFNSFEDLENFQLKMFLTLPGFMKKTFKNLKIKRKLEKMCLAMSSPENLFHIEESLKLKCKKSASRLLNYQKLPIKKFNKIFEIEEKLTDFPEIEDREKFYSVFISLQKNSEIIRYLLSTPELSDGSVFEEVIAELNHLNIRKDDKNFNLSDNSMNSDLTPQIVADFQKIRQVFQGFSLETISFEQIKLKFQSSDPENHSLTKRLKSNKKYFNHFKDFISKNFDREIYVKSKISSICFGSVVEFSIEKTVFFIKVSTEDSRFHLTDLIDMKERILLEKNSLDHQILEEKNEDFIRFVETLEDIKEKIEKIINIGLKSLMLRFSIDFHGRNLQIFHDCSISFKDLLKKLEKYLEDCLKTHHSLTFITPSNFYLLENFLLGGLNEEQLLELTSLVFFINPCSRKNEFLWPQLKSLQPDFKTTQESFKKQFEALTNGKVLDLNSLNDLIFLEYSTKLDFILKFLNIVCENQTIDKQTLNNDFGLLLCKTDDPGMALISIYAQYCGRLPLDSQVFHCRSHSSWIDLKIFMFRWIRSPVAKLFTLIEPENLGFLTQKRFIKLYAKFNQHEAAKPRFLCIITSDPTNPIAFYVINNSNCLREYKNEANIEESLIQRVLPWLGEVKLYFSQIPGTGKTTLIKADKVEFFYFELRISGNFNQGYLDELLDMKTFSKECHYHIILSITERNNFVSDFLFYLLVFRSVSIKNSKFFISPRSKFSIEIEDIKRIERIFELCPLLRFTKLVEISMKNQLQSLEINEKIETVCRFKYLLINGQLDDVPLDTPIEQTLLQGILYDKILKKEKNLSNFYQIRQYFNILSFIFCNFRQGIYNTDFLSELAQDLEKKHMKDLIKYVKNQKSLIVDEIFKTINNFCSKLEQEENEEEDPEICKKWKEVYLLFIYFNSSGSLFVITDDINKYPEDLKVISTIQNARIQDSVSNRNSSFFSKIFRRSNTYKLEGNIKEKKFKFRSIENTFDSLFSNLVGIVDKNLSMFLDKSTEESSRKSGLMDSVIGRGSDKSLEFKNYVLTIDNLIKMVLIYIRSKAALPIIIMGESGCGKTALIKYFVKHILKEKFLGFTVNAGTDLTSINAYIKEIKIQSESLRKKDLIAKKNRKLWVFFDEFNTSECVSYFSQILVEKRFKNEDLPANIVCLGACNPCKLQKTSETDEFGLAKSSYYAKKAKKAFIHNVKKLPGKILEHVWDFGELEKKHLNLYVFKMIEKIFENCRSSEPLKDKIVEIILTAHDFFTQNEGRSSVSLRDVSRFTDLTIWFYNYRQFFFENPSIGPLEKRGSWEKSRLFKSCILAYFHCYYLRIASKEARKIFLSQAAVLIGVQSEFLHQTLLDAQNFIMEQMVEYEGIGKNSALKENIYAIIPCICNKIPVFICGKPGSSKSLAVNYVFSSMRGAESNSPFLKNCPELFQIYYQGSHSSTSQEIENVFKKAEGCNLRYQNENLPKIPVVFFDEVGLAEFSPHNPLKVIHKYLEHENKDFGFIGISNWKMDASKMNRTLYLNRNIPDQEELQEIAENVCESYKTAFEYREVEIIRRSARVYYLVLKHFKDSHDFQNFYGLRDFYGTIRYLCRAFRGNEEKDYRGVVMKAFCHNFGGPLGVYQMLVDEFFKEATFGFKMTEQHIPKTLELIQWSLEDKDSRFILTFSNTEIAVFLLKNHVNCSKNNFTVMVGSQFESDLKSENHLLKIVSEISAYISKDIILILIGLERIYPSLYDLLNQNFKEKAGKKYCKITLGANCNYGSFVNENLKIVVIEDDSKERLSSIDPPFLNRFEKHWLQLDEVMTTEQKIHADFHDDLIKTLCQSKEGKPKLPLSTLFPLYDPLNIKFMALDKRCSVLGKCCCMETITRNSSADLHYLLNSETISDQRVKKELENLHNSTFYEDLEQILKTESKTLKLLALTYDSEEIKNGNFENYGISRKLGNFSREQELKTEINSFFKGDKKVFALEMSFGEESRFFFQVVSIAEYFVNEYADKAKVFVVLVRLSRNDRNREKIIYEPSWRSKMYDNLAVKRSAYVDASVRYTSELILKIPDCERFIKSRIVSLIKQSFFKINFNTSGSEFNFEKHRKSIVEQFRTNEQLCDYFTKQVVLLLQQKSYNEKDSNLIENHLFLNTSIKNEAKSTYHALEIIKNNELLNCVSHLVLSLEYYSSFSTFSRLFNENLSKTFDPVLEKIIEDSYENSFNLQLYQNNLTVLESLEFPFIQRLYLKCISFSTFQVNPNKLNQKISAEFSAILNEFNDKTWIKSSILDLFRIICEEVNFKYQESILSKVLLNYLQETHDVVWIARFVYEKRGTILSFFKLAELFGQDLGRLKNLGTFQSGAEVRFNHNETKDAFGRFQKKRTWERLNELIVSMIVSDLIVELNVIVDRDRLFTVKLFGLLETITKNEKISKKHLKNLRFISELVKISWNREEFYFLVIKNEGYDILKEPACLLNLNKIFLNSIQKFQNYQNLVFFTYRKAMKLDPELIKDASKFYSLSQTGKIIHSVKILNWILKKTQLDLILESSNCSHITSKLNDLKTEHKTLVKSLESALSTSTHFNLMFMSQLYESIKTRFRKNQPNSQNSRFFIDFFSQGVICCKKLLESHENSIPNLFNIVKRLKLHETLEIYTIVDDSLENSEGFSEYFQTIEGLFDIIQYQGVIFKFLSMRTGRSSQAFQRLLKNRQNLIKNHEQLEEITEYIHSIPLYVFDYNPLSLNDKSDLLLKAIFEIDQALELDQSVEDHQIFENTREDLLSINELAELIRSIRRFFEYKDTKFIRFSLIIIYCSSHLKKNFININECEDTSICSNFKNLIFFISRLLRLDVDKNEQKVIFNQINAKIGILHQKFDSIDIPSVSMYFLNDLIQKIIHSENLSESFRYLIDANYENKILKLILEKYYIEMIAAFKRKNNSINKEFLEFYYNNCKLSIDSCFTQDTNANVSQIQHLKSLCDGKNFPCLQIFLEYEAEITALSKFSSIVVFTNKLIQMFSFKLSRSEAKQRILEDLFNNNQGLEILYQKFEFSLKFILDKLEFMTLVKRKPSFEFLSRIEKSSPLNFFLVDDNKKFEGYHLAYLIRYMGEVHTKIALKIRNIKENYSQVADTKQYSIQKVYNEKIKYLKHTSESIIRNFSINYPNEETFETFYDFESLENSLFGLFGIDKLLDSGSLEVIQYSNEIFNPTSKYKDLIQELRRKGYAVGIEETTRNKLIKSLQTFKDPGGLLKLIFEVMIFLNQMDADCLKSTSFELIITGESGIRDILPYFIRNNQLIKALKCETLVNFLEIAEETCFQSLTVLIKDEYKNKNLDCEFLLAFNQKYNDNLYPSIKEICLALKRVMLRYLTADVEVKLPVITFLDNRSVWRDSAELFSRAELMFLDCWPNELTVEFIYEFYLKLDKFI